MHAPIIDDRDSRGVALAPRAGVGLKGEHVQFVLEHSPQVGFFEIHAENYMGEGGPPHRQLEAIRARHALSVHGVGLSLGAAEPPDRAHLARLQALVARYEPELVSEHLAWSSHAGASLNDLLPLPYTEEALAHVCANVDAVQTALGRRILIENPATYLRFAESTISEEQFLAALAARTGCGLLLDVSNVYVSAVNHGSDARRYLDAFPVAHVGEIHLAGFFESADETGARLLIDSHGAAVHAEVWALYGRALERTGPVPTLIEWDNDVPPFAQLHAQARRADAVLACTAMRNRRRHRPHAALAF